MVIENADYANIKAVPQHLPQRRKSQVSQLFHSRRSNRKLGPRLRPSISTSFVISPSKTLKQPPVINNRTTNPSLARSPSRIRDAMLRQNRRREPTLTRSLSITDNAVPPAQLHMAQRQIRLGRGLPLVVQRQQTQRTHSAVVWQHDAFAQNATSAAVGGL